MWGRGPTLFFCMEISSCLSPICWKDCSFPPLEDLGTLVGNQLIINVRVYFWTLNSIPLTYIPILTQVLHSLHYLSLHYRKFWASQVVLVIKNRFDPWVRKMPWKRVWQPTLILLPGESPCTEAWWACRFDPWVRKMPWKRVWQPTLVLLPGESPWAEEPGRLQSIGSQRVRYNSKSQSD